LTARNELPNLFVRSGDLHLVRGTASNVGANTYGWSTYTATFPSSTDIGGYNLFITPGNVRVSFGPNALWVGFPIRCLAY